MCTSSQETTSLSSMLDILASSWNSSVRQSIRFISARTRFVSDVGDNSCNEMTSLVTLVIRVPRTQMGSAGTMFRSVHSSTYHHMLISNKRSPQNIGSKTYLCETYDTYVIAALEMKVISCMEWSNDFILWRCVSQMFMCRRKGNSHFLTQGWNAKKISWCLPPIILMFAANQYRHHVIFPHGHIGKRHHFHVRGRFECINKASMRLITAWVTYLCFLADERDARIDEALEHVVHHLFVDVGEGRW